MNIQKHGAKLDSIADLVFVGVVLVKVLPELELSMWLLAWIVLIGIGKVSIVLYGYYVHKKLIMLHTTILLDINYKLFYYYN